MTKCPKCKSNIKYLHAYTEKKFNFRISKDGKTEIQELWEGDYLTSFECPECQEELFKYESDAIKFLKN